MLFPTPALSADDRRVLAEVDAHRDRLRHVLRDRPAPWTEGLRRFLTADAVAASNSIEGVRVSTVDVRDLMDGEPVPDVPAEDVAETLGYRSMMTYVQTLHDAEDFRYDPGLLNALHWILQGHRHSPRRPAGQWRRGPVFVTDARDPGVAAYTAPDARALPGLMAELVGWLAVDDGSPALVRAAMAHLHLVSIHPWADGNGRMSRSLQTLVIAREGVLAPEFSSIEAWLGRPGNTWEYYRTLAALGPEFRPDQDVSGWLRFVLRAYHEQAQAVQGRWDRSAAVWDSLATGAPGDHPRVVAALHEAAMTGRVTRAGYQRAEGLDVRTALRDLRSLVAAGALRADGNARARRYLPGPAFPAQALEIARTPTVVTDPYG